VISNRKNGGFHFSVLSALLNPQAEILWEYPEEET
jgi:hypothetical protein